MKKILITAVLAMAIASPASAKPGNGMPPIWFKPEVHPIGTGEPAPIAVATGQWQVTCKDTLDRCTALATESCPSGFDIVSDAYSEGGFRLTRTVKCR